MKSKITIAGHPIHPMLIAFPVAFYAATVVSFAVHATAGSMFWWRVGLWANLAGVVTALMAAIPGLVDLIGAIPSRSPAKRVGLAHGALNVTALGLFAANLYVQRNAWPYVSSSIHHDLGLGRIVAPQSSVALALCGAGFAATLAAGFLGWTLVQKHHVGLPAGELAPVLPTPVPLAVPPVGLSPR